MVELNPDYERRLDAQKIDRRVGPALDRMRQEDAAAADWQTRELRKWAWQACFAPNYRDDAQMKLMAARLVRFIETGSFDEVDKPA